ncbi:MAG: choice-of-anchor tandem repeat GloVer-containing protein [Candidatus Sulfotelmatobacter sp.]|jgi:uncharacterized repeat protein (TIGR03803 family)
MPNRIAKITWTLIVAVFTAGFAPLAQGQSFTFSTVATVDEGSSIPVVLDSSGNFYDSSGGGENLGSVFTVSKSGIKTELYLFGDSTTDGDFPSPLARDSSGNLYGTSNDGAFGYGLIFRVSPTGVFTNLHNFDSSEAFVGYQGEPLALDSAGNIYGYGGDTGVGGDNIFKLDTSGNLDVLYTFCSLKNCADGYSPNAPIRDSAGNIFGTTYFGGNAGCEGCQTGDGVVFKIDTEGVETVLHTFAGGTNDGLNPFYRLKQDNKGNLYGITSFGGKYGAGVLFKVPKAGGAETILYNFCSSSKCKDGQNPAGQVVVDAADNVYGIASGNNRNSVVWEVTTAGKEVIVYTFAKNNGAGGLTIDSAGNLYGTYAAGNTLPSIFKLTVVK